MQNTIRVNSRKFDGTIRRSWDATLIRYEPPVIELVGTFEFDVAHPDLGAIKRGTTSYEWFWQDRWHNVFRFHEPSGELRNHYLNLAMPPDFADGELNYIDLDIDILVWPDARIEVLDIDDFEANAPALNYPDDIQNRVKSELENVIASIRDGWLSRLDP